MTMQLMFQQSKIELVVPQIQFFARVLGIEAACRDWYAHAADHGGPVLGLVVDAPVVVQRQVLGCAMLGSTADTFSASVQGGLPGRNLIFSA